MTVRQSLRELPPTAWVLFAGTFVNRFGSFVIVFLVLYLRDEGFSTPQAGLAVSAYGVGGLAASLVGGQLADRLGRRDAIALSMFASAAAMLALSQAHTLPTILVLAALAGLAAEAYRPASAALLTDLTTEGDRVTAFAMYRLAINLGFTAGPAAAGFLAEWSFTWLFVGDAVTSVVYGVVALVAFPHGQRVSRHEERRGEALRTIVGDRAFLVFLAASTAGAFVYMQQSATFPIAVQDAGLSLALYGALVSLNGIVIVLVELPLTGVTRRFPPRPVIALGFLLVGVGFALMGLAETALAFAVTVAIWTLGEIVNAPVASAYVADLSPERLRGRYQGAWSFTWGLGLVLGPTVGTALYAWRPAALWLACLAFGALAAGLMVLGPGRGGGRAPPPPAARGARPPGGPPPR
ncbi:MAG: MDR family MFS transporter, partial [Pseudomonadota bacterium]